MSHIGKFIGTTKLTVNFMFQFILNKLWASSYGGGARTEVKHWEGVQMARFTDSHTLTHNVNAGMCGTRISLFY